MISPVSAYPAIESVALVAKNDAERGADGRSAVVLVQQRHAAGRPTTAAVPVTFDTSPASPAVAGRRAWIGGDDHARRTTPSSGRPRSTMIAERRRRSTGSHDGQADAAVPGHRPPSSEPRQRVPVERVVLADARCSAADRPTRTSQRSRSRPRWRAGGQPSASDRRPPSSVPVPKPIARPAQGGAEPQRIATSARATLTVERVRQRHLRRCA